MTLTLPPPLEAALTEQARRKGVTPEALALDVLQRNIAPVSPPVPQDEWERRLFEAAIDCGVSLTNEQLSREVMYDD